MGESNNPKATAGGKVDVHRKFCGPTKIGLELYVS